MHLGNDQQFAEAVVCTSDMADKVPKKYYVPPLAEMKV
jgi:hypothetical protein